MSYQNEPRPAMPQAPMDFSIDLRVIYFALLRRWQLIAGVALLSLIIGVLYIALQPSLYTANTVLQINVQDQTMVNMEAQPNRFPESANAVNSELDVIRSRTVARRVIDKLQLMNNPEFNPTVNEKLPPLQKLRLYVKSLFGSEAEAPSEEAVLIRVTNNVLDGLNVSMDARSYIVTVNFTSESPRMAQRIADAFAEEYLSYQIESRFDSNQRATGWLSKNVEELRQKAIGSEKAVQQFAEENQLYEMNDGRTMSDQQLEQLSTQLIQEEAALAQAQARLDRARQLRNSKSGISSVPEVLGSPLINNLREKEADLLRQKSELTSQFGPKHPKMNFINNQIEELDGKIDIEIGKIINGIANEVAIASQRVGILQERMNSQRTTVGGNKRLQVELAELRREADANAELYKTMLSGMKETGEAANMKQVNAKIISKADLPLAPSHPRKAMVLAFAFALGLVLGAALALLLEFLNQGFITLQAVEDNLGLPGISMIPETSKQQILADYASQHPASIYAESLRVITASLQDKPLDNRAKTVMLISSLPDEGKGWLSTSLARVIAKSGKKVLLLDCDLHRALSLHPNSDKPVKTLNDYLAGKAQLEEIIQQDSFSGMHYIGSSPDKRNMQELLDSPKMQDLMARIRDAYDLVILDSPPVLGMSDVLFLAKFADTALLVVRWLKTPRHVVENSLRILSHAKVNLTGVVLSRVDLGYYKKHAFGNKGYYDKFVDYYNPAS